MTDPWDWYIYLHLWLKSMVNVGKYSSPMEHMSEYYKLPSTTHPPTTNHHIQPSTTTLDLLLFLGDFSRINDPMV